MIKSLLKLSVRQWSLAVVLCIVTVAMFIHKRGENPTNSISVIRTDFHYEDSGTSKGKGKSYPNWVALVAVKKCGSAALMHMLEGHPDITFIPKHTMSGKCLPDIYTARDISGFMYLNRKKNTSYFLQSNQCFWNAEALGHLGAQKPIKAITMLCEPVHRVLSDFLQLKYRQMGVHTGNETVEDLVDKAVDYINNFYSANSEEIVAKQQQKLAITKPFDWRKNIVFKGIYVYPLVRYFKYFGRENVLVLNAREMIDEPWTIMTKVQEFLNLPTNIGRKFFQRNNKTGFYCLVRNHLDYCTHSEKSLTRGEDKPTMSPEHIAKLTNFFEPYNQKLFNFLGYKIKW